MKRRGLLLAAAGGALARGAAAQPVWPLRPITLVVPFAAGGIADATARSVAQEMGRTLGQAVIVDNRPSAGSVVGSAAVAKAAPDGHTLLLMSNANAISASLFNKLPFDVLHDFAPVSLLGLFDLCVFVGAASSFRTLAQFIAQAKAKPGRLTIGTISIGSTQHLAAELFKMRAGIDALVVPYKGTPAIQTALRSGEIDAAFEILGPMLPQVAAKAARALAIASEQRDPTRPDLPTVIEAGVPGYAVASWNALAAPAGTPAAVIERLNRAAREALAQPAVRAQLATLGVRAQAGTPQQLQALLAAETRRWGDVIRASKIERQ